MHGLTDHHGTEAQVVPDVFLLSHRGVLPRRAGVIQTCGPRIGVHDDGVRGVGLSAAPNRSLSPPFGNKFGLKASGKNAGPGRYSQIGRTIACTRTR